MDNINQEQDPDKNIDKPSLNWLHDLFGSEYSGTSKDMVQLRNYISGSSTDLGGTVTALEARIAAISAELSSLSYNQNPENINSKLQEVTNELASIKTIILPKLEETKKALDSVEHFLTEQTGFIINLISAEGKLIAIQGEINSLMGRIDTLEKTKERNWQRVATIVSLLVAIGALLLSIF